MNNSKILFEDHFKIYVLLKDIIIFEHELVENNIDYYSDNENQPINGNSIRYFIKDSDSIIVDEIFIKNGIIANIETIPTSDYRDEKKAMNIYFMVGGIVFGIMIFIILIKGLIK